MSSLQVAMLVASSGYLYDHVTVYVRLRALVVGIMPMTIVGHAGL